MSTQASSSVTPVEDLPAYHNPVNFMNDVAIHRQTTPTSPNYRARDFFLARQPILNREQELIAYELLFRTAASGPANVTNNVSATAAVIAHATELGMHNVLGSMHGFVNIDAECLMSDFIRFLPKEKVVLEVLETVEVNQRIVDRVAELKDMGYVFALDDVVAASANVEALLPLVELIKIDIAELDASQLEELARHFKAAGKKMLAEKVETREEFEHCLALGFSLFQGYYFAKPDVLQGKRLSPSQITVMQLLTQIGAHASAQELERIIKQDASLSLSFLRLVNRFDPRKPGLDSIGQAIEAMDRCHLQRWLQILLFAEPGKRGGATAPLLTLAATRGRLLELVAERIQPGERSVADLAFTVGMLSLTDALLGLPMEQVLSQIAVPPEVRAALLQREGMYGEVLRLAEYVEQARDKGPQIPDLLVRLGLSLDDFYELQLQAFEWTDSITHEAGASAG
jgi:c-di-GMP phosphodiesterase